ncbi:MAG: hypothetical protein Q8Q29_01995 [Actinomycetota bacterium]|nr:hypothetical protein [Actinomycetota bacterium]
MSRHRWAVRRGGHDLVVAVVAFWLIFAVVYIVGRVFIPTHSVLSFLATGVASGYDDESLLFRDLDADLLAVRGSGAVVQASGAVTGRFVLGQVISGGVSLGEGPPSVDRPVDVKVSLSGGGITLSVIAKAVVLGVPQQVARMTVVFTGGGKTFHAQAAACALELLESEMVIEQVGEGEMWLPSFTGRLSCNDLAELRTGEAVSFTAVVRYEPQVDETF